MRNLLTYSLMAIGGCVAGCSDSSSPDRPMIQKQNEVNSPDSRGTTKSDLLSDPSKKRPPTESADMTIPKQPVDGTVMGRPFRPDVATYNGTYLELRMGQEFFADASVKVFLFLNEESPAGKSFEVLGGEKFGSPHIHLSARLDNDSRLPETDLVTDGYAMRLEFDAEKNGEVPGRIFLQAPGERDSRFAGTFRATTVTDGSLPATP